METKNYLNIIKQAVEVSLKIEDVSLHRRWRHLVDARKIYCLLAKEKTHATLLEIGKTIDRDHATALYGYKMAKIHLNEKGDFKDKYKLVCQMLPKNGVFKDFKKLNKKMSLLEEIDGLKSEIEALKTTILLKNKVIRKAGNNKLTPLEVRYRELPEEKQKLYDMRVSAILYMLEKQR